MDIVRADELSIEYLAGLMDGEGCFRIASQNRSHGPLFYCSVTIRMRDDKTYLLRTIGKKFDGSLFSENRSKSGSINRNPNFAVEWRGPDAERICRQLLPYLIIKRDEAQVLIQFEELRITSHEHKVNRNKGGGRGGRRLPDSYFEAAQNLYLQCRELKVYRGKK